MPKMKSNRGASKRFKPTASGKLKRHKAFRSHILSTKSRKRKRALRKPSYVSKQETKALRTLVQA